MPDSSGNVAAIVLQLGALGSFLGGATTFLQFSLGKANMGAIQKKHRIILGSALLVVSALLLVAAGVLSDDRPLNEQLTTKAWAAHGDGDHELAINLARKCIGKFRLSAEREQSALTDKGEPPPPTGRVTEDEARDIFARGLLNDVATSYFIMGESARKLGRLNEARTAYEIASGFDYARTWDPKGWFWSPAAAADDQLTALKRVE